MCKVNPRKVPHKYDSIINDLVKKKKELLLIVNDCLNYTESEKIEAAEYIKIVSYEIRYHRDVRGKDIAKEKTISD